MERGAQEKKTTAGPGTGSGGKGRPDTGAPSNPLWQKAVVGAQPSAGHFPVVGPSTADTARATEAAASGGRSSRRPEPSGRPPAVAGRGDGAPGPAPNPVWLGPVAAHQLQRTLGNFGTMQLVLKAKQAATAEPRLEPQQAAAGQALPSLRAPRFGSRVVMGERHDPQEREAEAVARRSGMAAGPAPPLRHGARGAGGASALRSALESKIVGLEDRGEPLPSSVRLRQEATFGRDLSSVRIHRDDQAARVARELGAKAWTLGGHIAFAAGRFSPETSAGQSLLTHEMAHVVQAGEDPALVLRRQPDEEMAPADAPALDPSDIAALTQLGIELSPRDQANLATLFPSGFRLEPSDITMTASGESLRSFRLHGIQVLPPAPLRGSARVYLMQPQSKGRSIMIASSSGADSVVLDAGAGQVRPELSSRAVTNLADALQGLVSSRQAGRPAQLVVSHIDIDHFNAAREVLSRAEFSSTSVRVASELISGQQAGRWGSLALNVDRAQRVVEVQVTSATGAVHLDRQVFDGFELVEYRSVRAHREAQQGNYTRNAASPVSVVIDRNTGDRYVFSADAQGRQFSEVIDAIGDRAFRRLIGGSAGTLRTLEASHHGGMVSGSEDIRGTLRMLWFALEASGGRADVFAQTSVAFSRLPSEHLRFLELAGVSARRLTGPDAGLGAGQHQAQRVEGATIETVTFDAQRVAAVRAVARSQETPLRAGFAKFAEVNRLAQDYRVAQRALNRFDVSGESAVARAVATSLADIQTQRDGLRVELDTVRRVIETTAEQQQMRRSADMTAVARQTAQMTATAERIDTSRHAASLAAITGAMSIQQAMMQNAIGTLEAGLRGDFRSLSSLQAERRGFQRQARALLGNKLVNEHIRSAWQQVMAEETARRSRTIQGLLTADSRQGRGQTTAVRAIASESLARQIALNELMERAQHGQLPSARPMPMRTRMGAGFMALVELGRIGLETYGAVREMREIDAARLRTSQLRGLAGVHWWQGQGLEPVLMLVRRGRLFGYNVVSDGFTQDQLTAVVQRELDRLSGSGVESAAPVEAPEIPAEAMVVVRDLPETQLERLLAGLFARFDTLDDFERWNRSSPEGPAFKKFDDGWGVRVWDREAERYLYLQKRVLQGPLDQLETALEAGTAEALEEVRGEAQAFSVTTSGALWWKSRDVYVYRPNRTLKRIEFSPDQRPRFIRIGTRWVGRKEMVVVQAVDLATYRRLYREAWMVPSTGQRWTFYDASGRVGADVDSWDPVSRNSDGFALVEEGDLRRIQD